MREIRTYGSVRGASSNGRPYRIPAFRLRRLAMLRLRLRNRLDELLEARPRIGNEFYFRLRLNLL